MEPPASLVTKARTAFNSAAAKAERVLTDFKSDLIIDRDSDKQRSSDAKKQSEPKYAKNEFQWHHESKQLRWGPSNVVAKQDWQDKFKNIGRGGKGAEESESSAMAIPFLNENVYQMSMKNALESKGSETISSTQISDVSNNDFVPPTAIIKQLSVAVEAGKKLKSMKDLLASSGNTSPVRERASLSLSAMKSLVLREKEDKLTSEFGSDDKVQSLVHSLFVADIRRESIFQKEGWLWFRDIHICSIFVKRHSCCSSWKLCCQASRSYRKLQDPTEDGNMLVSGC